MTAQRDFEVIDLAEQSESARESGDAAHGIPEILRFLERRWPLIAVAMGAFLVLAWLYTNTLTPMYTATAALYLETAEPSIVDFQSVAGGLGRDSSTLDSEVEVIQERELASRVVDSIGLVDNPEFNSFLASRQPRTGTWWNPLTWADYLPQRARSVPSEAQMREQVIDRFMSRVNVERRNSTFIIDVSFRSSSPRTAMQVANAIAEEYIVDKYEARFSEVRRANEWLTERLEGMRNEVERAEQAVALYREQNNIVDADGTTLNSQQLTQTNQQLILASADRAATSAIYEQVSQIVRAGGDLDSIAQVLDSPTIVRLRDEEAELVRRQADLSSRYGERHPAIINLGEERSELERQINREIGRIVSALRNDVEVAQARVTSLETSLAELEQRQANDSRLMVRLRELERASESSRLVYEEFLNRFSETRQQENFDDAAARVIGAATVPRGQTSPNMRLNLFLGLTVGLFVGMSAAAAFESFEGGLLTRQQVESYLGIPHLAAIPHLRSSMAKIDGKSLSPEEFVLKKPLSSYGEALRAMRASLAVATSDARPMSILFTSSLPDEGKSTTALAYARVLSEAGHKVLLIDADLRHPSLTELLNIDRGELVGRGLVDVLVEGVDLSEAILRDPLSDLHIVPGGHIPGDRANIIQSPRMREIIAEAKSRYDYVILDSAPLLPVADSRLFAQEVDSSIFVIRWRKTPRQAVRNGLQYLQDFDSRIAGAVINMVDLSQQRKYGYGDSYAYYRRYSRYYDK